MSFSRTWAGVRPVLASRPEKAAVTTVTKATRASLTPLSSADHVAAQAPGVGDLHGVRRAVVVDGGEHEVVLAGPAPVQHGDARLGPGRDGLHRQPGEAGLDQFLPRGLEQRGLELLPAPPLAGPLPRTAPSCQPGYLQTAYKRGLHSLCPSPTLHKRRIHLL